MGASSTWRWHLPQDDKKTQMDIPLSHIAKNVEAEKLGSDECEACSSKIPYLMITKHRAKEKVHKCTLHVPRRQAQLAPNRHVMYIEFHNHQRLRFRSFRACISFRLTPFILCTNHTLCPTIMYPNLNIHLTSLPPKNTTTAGTSSQR